MTDAKEKNREDERPDSRKSVSSKSVPKNLPATTAKRLLEIKKEVNDKPFGRSIRESEIIELAINELKPKHIAVLKEMTLSGTDRLRLRHEEFQIENGEVSFDEFVDGLLSMKLKMPKMDSKVQES